MAIRASVWKKFLKSPILNRSVIAKIYFKQFKNLSSDFTQRQAGKCRCLACTKERQRVALHRFLTRNSNEDYEPSQPVRSKNFFGEDIRSMMVTFGPPQLNARRPLEPPCCQQPPPCLAQSCRAPRTSKDESILDKACNKMKNVCRDYCEPSSYSGGRPCTLETRKNSIICTFCEKIMKLCDGRCQESSQQSRLPGCCPPPPTQSSIEYSPQPLIECCQKPPKECSQKPSKENCPKPLKECCPKPPIECCPPNIPKCPPPPPPPPPEPIPCPPPRHAEICSPEPCPNSFCLVKKGPANKCKHICDSKKNRLPPKYSKPDCRPPSKCSSSTSLICCPPPPKSKEVCAPPTPPKCSPPVPSKPQENCPPPASKDCSQPAPQLSEICPPPMECCQPSSDCCQPPPPKCEPPPPKCEPPLPSKCEPPPPKCEPQPVPCPPARHAPPPKCGPPAKPPEKCCSPPTPPIPQPSDTRLCTDPASVCYQLLRNNILEMNKAGQMICHDHITQNKQRDIICQSCQNIWKMCKCDCYCGTAPTLNPVNSCKKLCTDPCGANYLDLKKKICMLYEAAMVRCDEPKVQLKQQEVICQGVRNIMAICDCCPKPCPKPPSCKKKTTSCLKLKPPPCPAKSKSIIETVKKFALSMYQPKTSCEKESQSRSCRPPCQSSIPAYSSSKTCSPKLCTDPNSTNFNKMRSIAKQIYDRSAAEYKTIADQEVQHTFLCRCCQKLWKICDCGCFDSLETLPKDPCKKLCTNPTSINYERMRKTICVLYETAMTTCKLPEHQKAQHRIICRCIRSIMEMCGCCPEPCPTHQPDCPSPPMVKCCEQPPVQTKPEKKSTDACMNCFEELTKTTCLLFEASKKLSANPSERKLISVQILKYCCKIQELCKYIDPSDTDPNSKGNCESSGAKKNYWLTNLTNKSSGCGQLRKYKSDSKRLGMDSNTNDEKSNLLNQDQIDEMICESCRNIILMCDCRRNSNLIQSRSLSHLNAVKQKSHQFFHDQQQRSVSSDARQQRQTKKVRLNRRQLKTLYSENKIKGSTKSSLFYRGRKSRSQRRYRSFSHYRYMGDDELVTKCWNKLYEIFERRSILYRNYELNKIEYVNNPLIKKNTVYAECVQRPEYLKKLVEDYVRNPTGDNQDENHSFEIQGSNNRLSTEKPNQSESVILPIKLQEVGHELNCKEITNKEKDLGHLTSKDTDQISKSTENEVKQPEEKQPILKEIVGTYNPETKKPLCIALVITKEDCGPNRKWHGEIGLVKDKRKWIEDIESRKLCGPDNKKTMQKLDEARDVPMIVAKEVKSVPSKLVVKSKTNKIIDSPNQQKIIDELKPSKSDESKHKKLIDKQKLNKAIEEPKDKESESKPKKCISGCPQEAKVACDQCQRNDSQISLPKGTNDRGLPKNQKSKANVKINEIDFKKAERLDKMLRLDNVLSSLKTSATNIDQGQFGFECITKKNNSADSHNKSKHDSKDIKPTKVDVNKSITNDKNIKTIVNHSKGSRSIDNTRSSTSKLNEKSGKNSGGDSHNKSGLHSEDIKSSNVDVKKNIANLKDLKIKSTMEYQKESRNLDNISKLNNKGGKCSVGDSHNKSGHDLEDIKPSNVDVNKSITNSNNKNIKAIVNHNKESRSIDNISKLNNKSEKSSAGHYFKDILLPKPVVNRNVINLWDKKSEIIVELRKEARSMDKTYKLINEGGKNTTVDFHKKSEEEHKSKGIKPTRAVVNYRKECKSMDNSSKPNDKYGEQGDRKKKSGNGHGSKKINPKYTSIRGLVKIGPMLHRKTIKTDESNKQKSKGARFMKIRLQPRVKKLKEIFDDANVDTIKPESINQNILKIQSKAKPKVSLDDVMEKVISETPAKIETKSIKNEFKRQTTNTESKVQIQSKKDYGFTKEAVKLKEWFYPFKPTICRPKFEENTSTVSMKALKASKKLKTSVTKDDQSGDLKFKKCPQSQLINQKSTLYRPKFEDNTSTMSTSAFKASKKLKTSGSKDDQINNLEFKKYPPWQKTNKKVSIVGGDHMGVACATALVSQNVTNNICVIDPYNHLKGEPNAMALLTNANILPSQDSAETKNSRVVVIATNASAQHGDKYVDVTKRSAIILKDMVPRLVQASPHAIFIVLTNPADLMTWYVKRISQLPLRRCFGAGCQLEAARFNYLISRRLNVPPSPVIGASIGRTGPTIMPVCSSVGVRGIPLHSTLPDFDYDEKDDIMKQVRRVVTAPTMVRDVTKRYTTWGIGNTTSDIVSAILTNSDRVLSVCTNAKGFHGLKDEVWLSLPCRFNHGGLSSILNIPLNDVELEHLHKSASAYLSLQHNIGSKILQIDYDEGDIDVE